MQSAPAHNPLQWRYLQGCSILQLLEVATNANSNEDLRVVVFAAQIILACFAPRTLADSLSRLGRGPTACADWPPPRTAAKMHPPAA